MHVGIALPNYGPLAAPAVLFDLAARAEDAGFDSVWVSDHLLAPSRVASVYPYDRRPNPAPGDVGVPWFESIRNEPEFKRITAAFESDLAVQRQRLREMENAGQPPTIVK
jgi:hypothetical protein